MQPIKTKTLKTQTNTSPATNPPAASTESAPDSKPKSGGALWRKLLAGFLGVIAFWLIIATVLSSWVNQTLTSTSRLTSIVQPLADRPAIQSYVSQKISQKILDNATTSDLEKQFLTPTQIRHSSPTQAKALLKPKIEAAVSQTLGSPAFNTLWGQTITSAHSQVLAAAKGSSPTASIDVQSQLNSFIKLLHQTKLGGLVKSNNLSNDSGKIALKADQLKNLRLGYKDLQNAAKISLAAAIAVVALTILVANRRWHAIRNLSLAIAAAMGLIVATLSALGRAHFSRMDSQEQGAVQAAINGVFASLKHLSSVLGLASLILALAVIFTPIVQRRLNTRKH